MLGALGAPLPPTHQSAEARPGTHQSGNLSLTRHGTHQSGHLSLTRHGKAGPQRAPMMQVRHGRAQHKRAPGIPSEASRASTDTERAGVGGQRGRTGEGQAVASPVAMQWQCNGKPMANHWQTNGKPPFASNSALGRFRQLGLGNPNGSLTVRHAPGWNYMHKEVCHWVCHWFAIGLPLDCHWIATGLPLDGGHSGAGRTAPLRSVTRRANNSAFRSPRRRAPPAPPAPEALPACVKSTLSGHQGSKFGPSQGGRDTPRRTPMRHVRPRPTRMGHASADASEASLGEASTDRARLSGHQ